MRRPLECLRLYLRSTWKNPGLEEEGIGNGAKCQVGDHCLGEGLEGMEPAAGAQRKKPRRGRGWARVGRSSGPKPREQAAETQPGTLTDLCSVVFYRVRCERWKQAAAGMIVKVSVSCS